MLAFLLLLLHALLQPFYVTQGFWNRGMPPMRNFMVARGNWDHRFAHSNCRNISNLADLADLANVVPPSLPVRLRDPYRPARSPAPPSPPSSSSTQLLSCPGPWAHFKFGVFYYRSSSRVYLVKLSLSCLQAKMSAMCWCQIPYSETWRILRCCVSLHRVPCYLHLLSHSFLKMGRPNDIVTYDKKGAWLKKG